MAEQHSVRRARVLERLGDGALVIPAGRPARRNGDADHPFRAASDLLYLTGFPEPESVLVLNPALEKPYVLFVLPRDREKEIWTGRRAGVEGAKERYGAQEAFTVEELDRELPRLLAGASTVHAPLGLDPAFDAKLVQAMAELRRKARGAPAPDRLADCGPLLHELRLFKDEGELALLRRAAVLTEEGHRRAMAATRPGAREYEIEAELLYAYRRGGGTGPGYEPIVAAGENATILHYRTGRDELREGELLLVDSGCEVDGYTADVTRTWPVGRRFEGAARTLYEIVLASHAAALDAVRPGSTLEAVHAAATRAIIRGLLEEKLLEGSEDSCFADKSFRRFFMHGTSHWLGLDVHDPGAYLRGGASRPLAPGMVFTVEPGLYVAADDEKAPESFRGIGIRIEDDVLVTAAGREVLTDGVPRSVADVEAMRAG